MAMWRLLYVIVIFFSCDNRLFSVIYLLLPKFTKCIISTSKLCYSQGIIHSPGRIYSEAIPWKEGGYPSRLVFGNSHER